MQVNDFARVSNDSSGFPVANDPDTIMARRRDKIEAMWAFNAAPAADLAVLLGDLQHRILTEDVDDAPRYTNFTVQHALVQCKKKVSAGIAGLTPRDFKFQQ